MVVSCRGRRVARERRPRRNHGEHERGRGGPGHGTARRRAADDDEPPPGPGHVEIGWWRRDEGGAVAQVPPSLELAAEAAEVEAFTRLCEAAGAARGERGAGGEGWGRVADGGEIAAAGPFADGARLVALRSGDEVAFTRPPEGDDLVLVPRTALERLVAETLPAAARKLAALGFGLPQQG